MDLTISLGQNDLIEATVTFFFFFFFFLGTWLLFVAKIKVEQKGVCLIVSLFSRWQNKSRSNGKKNELKNIGF
jgi:hypothetical protein